ncbi:ketopantoate reductase [Geothermobacter ehrlichii]|uniref:2-dehydropantoate 2-reductase n=1 Tax=Geothermobacter ehrlichii TaxID=213224 RepID=A0A5D3WHM2_9BACT|nr:putative 2-dehydropantoate 2-reductase [Geothermobacter ehrlichii]TYO96822.1 ketopantoate reductase [Geothermobacter ehrlichii]
MGEHPVIGVVGAGALGLYYGAMLQRSGLEVRFLLRRDFEAVRRKGLWVHSSVHDSFHLAGVRAFADSRAMGPVDLVLVGLKTFANHLLPELVRPLLKPETAILTLQNGLGNEELLADAFGAERVLGGVAYLCSNRGEPGHVHHLGEGRIRLGEMTGAAGGRTRRLAELFDRAGIPCEAVDDLGRIRWEKLVWNIPFNGLCALTGRDVTELLAHSPSARLVEAMMQEVVAAANRQPLRQPIDGDAFIARMLAMTARMDHYRPSMMIDRSEGRPLELDAIYAVPLRRAERVGSPMPRVAMLYSLLDLGEAGGEGQ